jgi:hypothetical protein
MMEIKKRSPHYHSLDDYELCFHLSMAEMLSEQPGPPQDSLQLRYRNSNAIGMDRSIGSMIDMLDLNSVHTWTTDICKLIDEETFLANFAGNKA